MGLVIAIYGKFDSSYIIGALIFLLIFLILGFVFDHFGYFNENLILESNSIVCTKKSLFRKRKFIYNIGDLDMFALYYKYEKSSKHNHHLYILYFVKKTGEKDKFLEFEEGSIYSDFQGVKYFIDLINTHINKNMK